MVDVHTEGDVKVGLKGGRLTCTQKEDTAACCEREEYWPLVYSPSVHSSFCLLKRQGLGGWSGGERMASI